MKSPGNLFGWICIHPEEGHPAFKNLFHSSKDSVLEQVEEENRD